MTVEADIVTALRTVCPRVSPDVAPTSTLRPYITWQFIGGRAWRFLAGDAPDKRHTLLQVNVWSGSRAEAQTLIRQVEAALCDPARPFIGQPESEPISDVADDVDPILYGAMQDYSITSSR
jgi:hypothetical protein